MHGRVEPSSVAATETQHEVQGRTAPHLERRDVPPELLQRAYTFPPRWPFDAFHLVMEFSRGTCDLYARRVSFYCCSMIIPHRRPHES